MALIVIATVRGQAPGPGPLVAFSSGGSVVLVSKTGEAVSTIKLPIKVGEFSFSPDLKKLVVVSTHPTHESGGKMYLYSLESKRLQRIPAKNVLPKSATLEVYSEPQFSPDGARLLFNVHPQADGGLYETSGPIAELDLTSFRARALEFTGGLVTDGMLLSPNGREFLLWDEGKVIDTSGITLFDFHEFQLEEPFKWALDEAWVGNSCVLYEAGKSANSRIKGEISYFILNLKTLKSTSTLKTLGLSDKDLDGIVSYRYPYVIVKSAADSAGNRGAEYFLISPDGARTKLTIGDATVVQVLPNKLTDDSPSECR